MSTVYPILRRLTCSSGSYHRKRCRHSFSKDAILSHLGGKPKACPTTGCKNIIYPNELFEDKELKKKVENMLRRERMREDEVDDVDDVVE